MQQVYRRKNIKMMHNDDKNNCITMHLVVKNETGISLIDDQHECLVAVINSLYCILSEKKLCTAALPLIDTVLLYSSVHHNTEKSVLVFCDAHYAKLYDLEYQDLLRQLSKMESLLRKNVIPQEMFGSIENWWKSHLENHREFFAGVREKALRIH